MSDIKTFTYIAHDRCVVVVYSSEVRSRSSVFVEAGYEGGISMSSRVSVGVNLRSSR